MEFEDFLSILVIIVLYVAVAVLGNKKGKAQKAKQQAKMPADAFGKNAQPKLSAKEKLRQQELLRQQEVLRQQAAQRQAQMAREPLRTSMEGEDPCHQEQLSRAEIGSHFHETKPEDMAQAGEGEDLCHPGKRYEMQEEPYGESIIETDAEALRRQLLTGVVMSEILNRPARKAYRNRS